MPRRKITFIGSGQITAALSTLLILRNRSIFDQIDALKEAGKIAESERLDNEIIEISILGRQGSESLKAIKERGFKIKTINLDNQPEQVEIYPEEFLCITDNADEIGKQDDIFLATKSYSYDQTIIDSIRKLQIGQPVSPGRETNIILAQNGIPFWFEGTLKIEIEPKDPQKEGVDFATEFKQLTNLVGAVLNFACCVNKAEDGKPDYNSYTLITARKNIAMPLKPVEGGIDKTSFRHLLRYLPQAKIDIASRESSLVLEMLLKLQVNTALGLCTLTGKTVGEVVHDEKLEKILAAIANEINQFAQHLGCPHLRDEKAFLRRIEPSHNHLTSMGIDFNIGRPIEFGIYKETLDLAARSGFTEISITRKLASALENLVIMRDAKNDDGHKKWTIDEVRESSINLETLDELYSSALTFKSRSRPVSPSLAQSPSSAQAAQGSPSTSRFGGPRSLSGASSKLLPTRPAASPALPAAAAVLPTDQTKEHNQTNF